ncbi:MAG: hypothetical protein U0795_16210 [Pirellulales bacterium]
MDPVRKKVLLDLFASPSTVLPIAGGLTLLIGSWAAGGNAPATFAGVAGVLTGLGMFASRIVLGLEDITHRAYDYVVDNERHEEEERLTRLQQRLLADGDPRTDSCLAELRSLQDLLQSKVNRGELGPASSEVLDRVKDLYRTCIHQLGQSVDLWDAAGKLNGTARRSVLQQRDQIVREVTDSIAELGRMVDQFLQARIQQNRTDLKRLRGELESAIDVARRAEQRTAEWEREARNLSEPDRE